MIQNSVELGEYIATDDPVVCRYLYNAYHRIAETNYQEGRLAEADPYSSSAIQLAERMAAIYEGDPEWMRVLGLAYSLQGKGAFHHGRVEEALEAYDKCAHIRVQLSADHPDNDDLQEELASLRSRQGRCYRVLERYEQSYAHYDEALQIRRQLYDAQATDDRAISLCASELKLAAWHLSQKDPRQDAKAAAWLDSIENRLKALQNQGRLESRRRDADRLHAAVKKNRSIIAKRSPQSS